MIGRSRRLGMLLALVAVATAGCRSEAPLAVDQPVERVLVVSLPGVSWSDARRADLPTLDSLVRQAAVGDLATRVSRRRTSTTDAYLTIGAGTRALAPPVDVAVALDPDESYGGLPSRDIIERRLGTVPAGITYLATGAAVDLNAGSAYDAEVGLLGDALEAGGVGRAVIANADAAEGFVSEEPPPDGAYARSAATALMGSDGVVPGGTVGRGLLLDDPHAPFGRRLDPQRVLDAFDAAWERDRVVVLVEASDLSRAAAYGPRSTPGQDRDLRDHALEDADGLLASLLSRVDPEHDAVLVVSPVAPEGEPELGVVALRAPGVDPGVLRSASTRRDGYVQLADVAPTILGLLGLDPPVGIEGEPFGVRPRPGEDRVEGLVEAADAAQFRDEVLPAVVTGVTTALALLCLATWQRRRLSPGARAAIGPVALAALGFVPATYLIGRLQATVGAPVGYTAGILTIAAVYGLAALAVQRRWAGIGPLVAVAGIVGLFVVDVSIGAPLQLNTVFGYSVAVAGRFAGVGNLAFALFGAAAILLAVLIVDRYGDDGVGAAVLVLGAVAVVEGLPMLGADVGGVLSMVPAFGVTLLILSGRRARAAHLVVLAAVGLVTVVVFAAIDLARPEAARTHLGRMADDIRSGRWDALGDTIARRWQASFGGAEVVPWLLILGILVATAVYVGCVAAGWLGPEARRRRDRQTLAAVTGLGVLAAVGMVANDSSIAVPTTMLIVIAPVMVLRTLAGRPLIGTVT